MQPLMYEARDPSETETLAAALAQTLPAQAVIALWGTLGAGKTRLVQAVAAASGVDRHEVVSPTFVLIHQYHGRHTIYHMDAYRIRDDDEFWELGPEEYFEAPAWTFIEWADRVENCLPDQRLDMHIEITGPTARRFTIVPRGERYAGVVSRLAALLNPQADQP